METNSPPAESPTPKRKSHWIRWIKRGAIALAVLIVLLILLLPTIVRGILRYELQSQIAANMNATVEVGDIVWHPLLGITIGQVRLMGTAPDGSPVPVAELNSLNTSLASIPLGGPIIVSDFVLLDPTLNLIQLPSGDLEIQQNLLKPQPASTSPKPASGPMAKPSTIIQVKHFKIQNMTVQVLDAKNPSAPGVTLLQLDVEGHQTGAGPGTYDIHVALVGKPLADVALDTSVNLDGPDVTLTNFSVNVTAPKKDALGQLPPAIASFIKDKNLTGAGIKLTLDNGAAITVDTNTNVWKVAGLAGRIDVTGTEDQSIPDSQLTFAVAGNGPLPGTSGAQAGSLTVTVDAKYGVQPIHLDLAAAATAAQLSVSAFHLNFAEGTVVLNSASVDLTAPYHYAVDANYQNLQLADIKQLARLNDPKLAGIASGKVSLSGTLPPGVDPLTAIAGQGDSRVEKADLWDIPLLGDLASKLNPNFGSLGRIGEADVAYTLGSGTVHLSQLEVTSPIIGVQCHGDVGLTGDNQLDVLANIAPLGDWQKSVNNTGVPGISILGNALGQAQGVINKAGEQVGLAFHVTGPAAHPTLLPVVAEKAGGSGKNAVGKVLQGGSDIGNGILNIFGKKNK